MSFLALDVETANSDYNSICQIGIAKFVDGSIEKIFDSYINPEDYFEGRNVAVHGITPEMVANEPTFKTVYKELKKILADEIVIHHTAFDRVAMTRVCSKYKLPSLEVRWLDSARIARRTWDQFSRRGYGLSNLAAHFGIVYGAHDAFEDAVAAGKIVLLASEKKELNIDELYDYAQTSKRKMSPPTQKGGFQSNPEGE